MFYIEFYIEEGGQYNGYHNLLSVHRTRLSTLGGRSSSAKAPKLSLFPALIPP